MKVMDWQTLSEGLAGVAIREVHSHWNLTGNLHPSARCGINSQHCHGSLINESIRTERIINQTLMKEMQKSHV